MTDVEKPVWEVHRTALHLVGPIAVRSRVEEVVTDFQLAVGLTGPPADGDAWDDPITADGAGGSGLYYLTSQVPGPCTQTLYLRYVDDPEHLVQDVAVIVRT